MLTQETVVSVTFPKVLCALVELREVSCVRLEIHFHPVVQNVCHPNVSPRVYNFSHRIVESIWMII